MSAAEEAEIQEELEEREDGNQEEDDEQKEEEEDILAYLSDDGNEDKAEEEEEELVAELKRLKTDLSSGKSIVNHCADRVVVVQDLPITGTEKIALLRTKVGQIFSQAGALELVEKSGDASVEQDPGQCVFLPLNQEKTESLGFAFIPFKTADAAALAVSKVNGQQFGKNKLRVFPYSDLDKYAQWPDKFVAPVASEFKRGESLNEWLLDSLGRDQYAIRHDANTEIYWFEGMAMDGESSLAYAGERETATGKVWCEMYVAWSPKGSFFATFHLQGVALWGTNEFVKTRRFPHHGVERISFSPCEKYLITWDGKDNGRDQKSLMVWDVKTGKELRGFAVPPKSEWPIMRWSHDGEYFARAVENGISVFESKSMRMLGGKPVVAKGIVQFEWSPKDTLLAYWSAEDGNIPARVTIMDPTKQNITDLRSKNLVNVSSVKLQWQSAGELLCAQVLRHTKSKKTTFTNIEIFRMRIPGIPNETLNITDPVLHFSFEPQGSRFGVITGDEIRTTISFYEIGRSKSNSLVLLETLSNRQFSAIHWSPAGQHLVLSNFASNSGNLEFWDLSEKKCLAADNHFMCNEVHWDPSGRIVATCVVQPMFGAVSLKYTMENGYKFWTFQGDKLSEVPKKKFHQFAWRPRPRDVLSETDINSVKTSLTKYLKKYENEDGAKRKRKELAKNQEKIRLLHQFRSLMSGLQSQFVKDEEKRRAAGLPSIIITNNDAAMDEVEYVIEDIISETKEEI